MIGTIDDKSMPLTSDRGYTIRAKKLPPNDRPRIDELLYNNKASTLLQTFVKSFVKINPQERMSCAIGLSHPFIRFQFPSAENEVEEAIDVNQQYEKETCDSTVTRGSCGSLGKSSSGYDSSEDESSDSSDEEDFD